MPHRLYGILPLSRDPVGRALADAGGRGDRALPGRRPAAHPVRRLGSLPQDADGGHCRHSRHSVRPARPGERRLAGDGRRSVPRAAGGKGSGDRRPAEVRRSPAPCARLGSLGRDRPTAQRLAGGGRRAAALALHRRAARSRTGVAAPAHRDALRCHVESGRAWRRCVPSSSAGPIPAGRASRRTARPSCSATSAANCSCRRRAASPSTIRANTPNAR